MMSSFIMKVLLVALAITTSLVNCVEAQEAKLAGVRGLADMDGNDFARRMEEAQSKFNEAPNSGVHGLADMDEKQQHDFVRRMEALVVGSKDMGAAKEVLLREVAKQHGGLTAAHQVDIQDRAIRRLGENSEARARSLNGWKGLFCKWFPSHKKCSPTTEPPPTQPPTEPPCMDISDFAGLQDAIAATAGLLVQDIIICNGAMITFTSAISLTNEAFALKCEGGGTCTLQGDGSNFSAFEAQGGNPTMEADGVTFQGFDNNAPGAVLYALAGTYRFANCIFQDNQNSAAAGAVYLFGGAEATFTDCDFLNNASQGGGALYLQNLAAGVQITGCTFDGNTATNDGKAILSVANTGTPAIVIKDSTFTGAATPYIVSFSEVAADVYSCSGNTPPDVCPS